MGLFSSNQRFERVAPDRYEVRLVPDERSLLDDLCRQLGDLLETTTDDPSVRRLFPTAYHDDAERDREYQQLVRDELLTRRLAALTTVRSGIEAETLDQAGLTAWMGALNDLRLVLGTRLDISEDDAEPDPDDPEAPTYYLYHYLSALLADVVDALEDGLGDLPPDAP